MARLKLATDCSGIEVPVYALQQMGIVFEHVFSSDISEQARRSIEECTSPAILYHDVKDRNNSVASHCDVYVAGFPCSRVNHFLQLGSAKASQMREDGVP